MTARFVLLFALAGAETADVVPLDASRTPFQVSGGVQAFAPAAGGGGTMRVRLRGSMRDAQGKSGELLFDLRRTPLAGRAWNNRAHVETQVRVSAAFVGDGKRNWQRPHRARLFLEDARRRRLYLPNRPIVDRPRSTDGWLAVGGLVTVDVPMPLGLADEGFDPARVTGLGVNVEAFNREGETVSGEIELRDVRVSFTAPVAARVLPADPAVAAGEGTRG